MTVEPVRQEMVRRAVEVVGTLAAQDEVTISSQAEGAVSRILADLGDRVHAGDALVELDREKSQYTFDQQKAALARALAKYGAPDTEHLPPIEQTPDVQKAQAELGQARQAWDRADELHKRQLVPKQALDDAEATLHSKQASYDASLQNAKNLRADIDASNATMKLADRQMRDTSIRAPFDGYVQKRMVSLGEFVKNQTPVMSVVRVDPLKVTAEIPERMAPWIQVGQHVDLRVDAFPDKPIAGTVSRISPAVNTQTRAFSFEARVPNPDAQHTAIGWEVFPDGLHRLLVRVAEDYAPPAIYVTENGAAFGDVRVHDGAVHDPERTAYLEAYIDAMSRAIADGAPVKGYFVWSFLDNFEWAHGYSKRFGLVYVDYPTLERVPKDSFYWYRDFLLSRRGAPSPSPAVIG